MRAQLNVRLSDLEQSWPSVEQVVWIYNITPTVSSGEGIEGMKMLRRFTASCIAANSPFEQFRAGSFEHRKWEALFSTRPEISFDVLKGGKWHEKKPWDVGVWREWLVHERGLREVWEDEFLGEESGTRRVQGRKIQDGKERGVVRDVLMWEAVVGED